MHTVNPSKKKPTILLIEDSPSLAATYKTYLDNGAFNLVHVANGIKALNVIKKCPPQAILLDLRLPDIDGLDILKLVYKAKIPSSVVIITGHWSINIAVEAMRYEAFDFLEKPFTKERLMVTVQNAIKHQQLTQVVATYQENFDRDRYQGFIGASLPMQGVYRMIESAAPSRATVFITGESGTGKELCAEAIHNQSPRQTNRMVTLNCAAIPKNLMESEIFGHVRGAFTGASNEREGAASQAHEGTLFLDEICEMDLELQSKLLRFIQSGTFQKVGSNKLEKVDIRFICATNRDPWMEVQKGNFREDLYFRLQVIPLQLPSLRERDQDVLVIARTFLATLSREENKQFQSFSPEVETFFLNYSWPGNVRQLLNVIQNVVVLHQGSIVELIMLPPPLNEVKIQTSEQSSFPQKVTFQPTVAKVQPDQYTIRPLWVVEKEAIEQAIEQCGGSIPKASELLEINPSTIYRKRQTWVQLEI